MKRVFLELLFSWNDLTRTSKNILLKTKPATTTEKNQLSSWKKESKSSRTTPEGHVRMLGCVLCLPVHARFRWGHLDLPLLFLQWLSTWLIVEVKPLDRKAISEFWFLMKKCIIFWVKGEGEVTVLQNNCWNCVLKTELGKLIPLKQFPQGYYKDLAL